MAPAAPWAWLSSHFLSWHFSRPGVGWGAAEASGWLAPLIQGSSPSLKHPLPSLGGPCPLTDLIAGRPGVPSTGHRGRRSLHASPANEWTPCSGRPSGALGVLLLGSPPRPAQPQTGPAAQCPAGSPPTPRARPCHGQDGPEGCGDAGNRGEQDVATCGAPYAPRGGHGLGAAGRGLRAGRAIGASGAGVQPAAVPPLAGAPGLSHPARDAPPAPSHMTPPPLQTFSSPSCRGSEGWKMAA